MWKSFLAVSATLIAVPAWGAVTSVDVQSTKSITLGGKPYVEKQVMMKGSVQGRTYEAPCDLLHPQKVNQANGAAIVEAYNYTLLETCYLDTGDQFCPPITPTREILSDFMGQEGYTYMSCHWNAYDLKLANEELGQNFQFKIGTVNESGEVENAMDAHQIIADIPSALRGGYVSGIKSPSEVISVGFSGASAFLREHFLHQADNYPGASDYNGFLQLAMGPFCIDMNWNTVGDPENVLNSFPFCADPIEEAPAAGKVMIVNSESDRELFYSDFTQCDTPSCKTYEIAGGSHIPKGLSSKFQSMTSIFPELQLTPDQFAQNVAQTFVPARAAFNNMLAWIRDGVEPPPSVLLGSISGIRYTGNVCATDFVDLPSMGVFDDPETPDIDETHVCDLYGSGVAGGGFFPVFELEREAISGIGRVVQNASGGLRLPHIDVPLGEYFGVEYRRSEIPAAVQSTFERMIEVELGGYYSRLTDQEINTLYPTNKIYVNKVVNSALNALNNRWILPQDYAVYVNTAKNSAIGKKTTYTNADLEVAHGL